MRLILLVVCLWSPFLWGSLSEEIEKVIREGDPTALVGIEVYSPAQGKVLYQRNGERRFVPASCVKVVTAGAALYFLGKDFCFETKLMEFGEKNYLVGSGDPSLGFEALEKLVLQAKGSDILIDATAFEGPVKGPGWMWDEEPARWCVPMSGLNLEHNFVDGIVIDEPEVLAGVIGGGILERAGRTVKVGLGKAPIEGKVIATHYSENLSELLKKTLKNSDNLYANCLFRTLGGSWEESSKMVGIFLQEEVGIPANTLKIVDGSGESRYNLMTPHHFVEVLKYLRGNLPFREALSVSGVDGTLRNRMKEHLIWGKTGGMTGVSTLCGYLVTQTGEELIVTILVNGYVKEGREIRTELIDKVCQVLAQ